MENNDSVRKLVNILEPLTEDLDEQKRTLEERKEELESVSRLIAYTKDSIEMVGIYADQDLILNMLDKLNITAEDYKASCYLLKSESESVKALPQYAKSYDLIGDIIQYFKLHKAELTVEIQELNDICQTKELEKKYCTILNDANPLIEDVEEFTGFLKNHSLSDEDTINILYSTIRSNIVNYGVNGN